MMIYKPPEWYEGHLCALRSTLYFAEMEMENADFSEQHLEAEVFVRWLREAIEATEEEAKEAKVMKGRKTPHRPLYADSYESIGISPSEF